MPIAPFKALALQISCNAINDVQHDFEQHRLQQIERVGKAIQSSKAFIGQDLKLVVLPEYFLTSFPARESIAEWQMKGCVAMQGDEYESLKAVASKLDIYLSGNVYELDNNFTELYFQTSFIISPKGEMILRYRRLNSMFAATPHDVLDDYLRIYGADSLFPVAKTDIGNLACIASEEILYPEIARCLAMRGAEIFCHNTSEIGSLNLTMKNIAKQARAIENMAYVVSANSAGIYGTSLPANSTDGHSQIVNYEGMKKCEAGFGESMVANTTLDIETLRAYRMRPGMSNFLSRQRFELFAPTYQQVVYPANSLANKVPQRSHFVEMQKEVIQKINQ
jgi:deaminated glutathione amidase